MNQSNPAEREMAALVIAALNLEDRHADTVDVTVPLFGSATAGWGLDSIDALEIVLAIQQKYGVELRAEDDTVTKAFSSLRALTALVSERRVR
jgi:acyl carrier protein